MGYAQDRYREDDRPETDRLKYTDCGSAAKLLDRVGRCHQCWIAFCLAPLEAPEQEATP